MLRKTLLLSGLAGLVCLVGLATLTATAQQQTPTHKRIEGWRQNARAATSLIQASIKCDVKPKDAQVYVDGSLVGTARDYNSTEHPLYMFAGQHTLEFRYPGHETYSTKLDLMPEQDMRLKVRMQKLK